MLTTNDDDGYETDATILDEDYDSKGKSESESEGTFIANNRKRKISTPSTPEPMTQGPEPSTEILNKRGRRMFTRFERMLVPYTRNSSNNGEMPLDINGEPIDLEELPPSIQRNLFEGGVAKSRRRRRAKKSSRKRNSRHTRKSAHKRRARSTRSKH
jgi:hypothetical protein